MRSNEWEGASKKTRLAKERDEEARGVFRQAIALVPAEKLVFLDECHFALNLHRLYGWTIGGGRCAQEVPFEKGFKRSVVGAFSLPSPSNPTGLWALWQKRGLWKGHTFALFVAEAVLSVVPVGSVLVLDNARLHHSVILKQLVEEAGCSLMFLPPYSPDFNPIEPVWSWIKNAVRARAPRTDEQRQKDIRTAQSELPPQAAQGWFKHCGLC